MLRSDCAKKSSSAYHLILFVAGDETNSRLAKTNIQQVCDSELSGNCNLIIVDVLEDFQAAARNNILVTPTLLVCKPEPGATVIGNLSDRKKLRAALGLNGDR